MDADLVMPLSFMNILVAFSWPSLRGAVISNELNTCLVASESMSKSLPSGDAFAASSRTRVSSASARLSEVLKSEIKNCNYI